MRLLKSLFFASFVALAGSMVLAPVALAGDPPKAEKKCDKSGKPCDKGDDCKAENCKK